MSYRPLWDACSDSTEMQRCPVGHDHRLDVEDALRDQLQLMHLQTWPPRQCNHGIAWKRCATAGRAAGAGRWSSSHWQN